MTWKHDEPEVSRIEYDGFAPLPIGCNRFGGSQVGEWQTPGEFAWLGRICAVGEHAVFTGQMIPHEAKGYTRTNIGIYTKRFVQFDPSTAQMLERRGNEAGLPKSAFPPFL